MRGQAARAGSVETHWGDQDGEILDPEKVKAGMLKEVTHLKLRYVYLKTERQKALKDKDTKLIKTRWVKTKKDIDVWCSFVAQEIAAGDPRSDLFAGTPPLFAARLLVSMAASG